MVIILDDEHGERLQKLADESGQDPEYMLQQIMDEHDRLAAVLRRYAEVIARWSVEDMMKREETMRKGRKSFSG